MGNRWRRVLLLGVCSIVSARVFAITDIAFDNPLQAFQSSGFFEKFVAIGAHQPKFGVSWQVGPPGCLTNSGLSLDAATGVLSGHPGALGVYDCTITGTDSFDQTEVTQPFTLIIKKKPFCSAPKLGGASLPAAIAGVPYRFVIFVSGSPAPMLAVIGLPQGLKFDAVTAMISGTPTMPGSSTVTITATNRCAPPVVQTQTLTVALGSTALALIAAPNPALFGDPVSVTVTTSGGRNVAQGAVQLCVRASAGYCGAPFDVVPPGTTPDRIRAPLTAALDTSGRAQFSLVGLLIDNYTLIAMYAGDNAHLSASSMPVDEYVIKGLMLAPPQVVVIAPLDAAASAAMKVTVTVRAAGAGPTPTGAVQLLSTGSSLGVSALDASGTARFNIRAGATGRLTLHAEYRGDTWFPPAASPEADVIVAEQDPRETAASAIPALSSARMAMLSALIAMLGLLVLWRRAREH